MRISDWSSDVCSSDLPPRRGCADGAERRVAAPAPIHADRRHGRTQPTHDRGGKSAPTHHRQSRLTMAHGHSRNYTTLTDATAVQSWRQGFRRRLTYHYAWVDYRISVGSSGAASVIWSGLGFSSAKRSDESRVGEECVST